MTLLELSAICESVKREMEMHLVSGIPAVAITPQEELEVVTDLSTDGKLSWADVRDYDRYEVMGSFHGTVVLVRHKGARS